MAPPGIKVSDNQNLVSRAWYYIHITADPVDADTVYVNNLDFWKSYRRRRDFCRDPTPHGDNHDLWIDPKTTARMIQGERRRRQYLAQRRLQTSVTIYNQPTAQFYHMPPTTLSLQRLWHPAGQHQRRRAESEPSRGISWRDCYVAGTGESGYIAVRPDNPDIVYVGAIGSSPGGGNALQRYDRSIDQIRLITSWPEMKSRLRRQRAQTALRLDLPDRHLPARSQHPLHRRRPRVQEHQRGPELGTDQP